MSEQLHFRDIARAARPFRVVDSAATRRIGFWEGFASGAWEPETLDAIGARLGPGDLLLDVGAWVGPMTIWAASQGARVVAVEPDPAAFAELLENVHANGLWRQVQLVRVAVADGPRTVPLGLQGGGDSMSSMTRTDTHGAIDVPATTLGELIELFGRPTLLKMDVEGGESVILPHSGRLLRRLGVPLLLATHERWYAPGTAGALDAELACWNTTLLARDTLLCLP